jgi:hypothetical protein
MRLDLPTRLYLHREILEELGLESLGGRAYLNTQTQLSISRAGGISAVLTAIHRHVVMIAGVLYKKQVAPEPCLSKQAEQKGEIVQSYDIQTVKVAFRSSPDIERKYRKFLQQPQQVNAVYII